MLLLFSPGPPRPGAGGTTTNWPPPTSRRARQYDCADGTPTPAAGAADCALKQFQEHRARASSSAGRRARRFDEAAAMAPTCVPRRSGWRITKIKAGPRTPRRAMRRSDAHARLADGNGGHAYFICPSSGGRWSAAASASAATCTPLLRVARFISIPRDTVAMRCISCAIKNTRFHSLQSRERSTARCHLCSRLKRSSAAIFGSKRRPTCHWAAISSCDSQKPTARPAR